MPDSPEIDPPLPEPAPAASAWPPDGPAGEEPRPTRTFAGVAWVVIAVVVVLRLASPVLFPEEPESAADDPVGELMIELQGRYAVGAAEAMGSGSGAMLLPGIEAIDAGPVPLRQRFVVLAGDLAGAGEARQRLDALNRAIEEERDRTASDEHPFELTPDEERVQQILGVLYPPPPEDGDAEPAARPDRLTPDQRSELEQQLGWFGRLALVPPSVADAAARHAVTAAAIRTFGAIAGVGITALVVGAIGFTGLIVVLVLVIMAKLPLHFVAPGHGRHGVYVETFAIWLVAFILLQLGAELVAPGALLVVFVVFLASLGALAWPVARGVPWQQVREDIGWTRGRGVVLEPLTGLGSYAMALPILAVGVAITYVLLLVDTALAGEGSPFAPTGPPAHPIVLEISRGNLSVVLQILLIGSVGAPIVEETMFRGVLYRHLRDATAGSGRLGSVLLASAINAFVFAIIHPQGWIAVPALMSLAIAFSLAREWRGSIVPSAVMHGLSNGIVLSLLAVVLPS